MHYLPLPVGEGRVEGSCQPILSAAAVNMHAAERRQSAVHRHRRSPGMNNLSPGGILPSLSHLRTNDSHRNYNYSQC